MAYLSNAELIHQVQLGHVAAFEQLLNRHNAWIYGFALRVTHNDEEAKDLSQEICIEFFRSLSNLNEIPKFKSWLATIARRVAYRWQKGRRITFSLEEDQMSTCMTELRDQDVLTETKDHIEKTLRVLSHINQQIIIRHYIDGYGMEEISQQLNIPIGTVKRRLHDARNQLRKEIIMTEAPMKNSHEIKPIQFSTMGTTTNETEKLNPIGITQSLLAGQILRSIRYDAKSPEKIAQDVGAAVPYVEDHIHNMMRAEIILQEKNNRYRTGCTIILEREWHEIQKHIRKIGKRDAEIITEALPEIKEAFETDRWLKQGFHWDHWQWLALPAFISSIGIWRQRGGISSIGAPLRPDGGRWHLMGIEGHRRNKWQTTCGAFENSGFGMVDFHLEGIKKAYTTNCFGEDGHRIMKHLATGPQTIKQIEKQSGLGVETIRTKVATLCEYDYVVNENDKIRANFPFINETDDQRLIPVINKVCNLMIEENHKPGQTAIEQMYKKIGIPDLNGNYNYVNVSSLAYVVGYCCEYLVKIGTLPPPPKNAPPTWGFCGWVGACESVKFV